MGKRSFKGKYKQNEVRPMPKKIKERQLPRDKKKFISMYRKQKVIAAKVVLYNL